MNEKVFCFECMEEQHYILKKDKITKKIRDNEYEFVVENAYCEKCGARVHVHGLDDQRASDIDLQYRSYENIVTTDDINKLMNIYNIGKGPLSLSLGFGEITIKRYLMGVVPSKEYSNIIKKALEEPTFYLQLLEKNKDKLNSAAYSKALSASKRACQISKISDPLLATISYIFYQLKEVTPLALQKNLYFIQAHHLLKYQKPLFEEDCLAWEHGPVYNDVYRWFKECKYHVIEDDYYSIIKDYHRKLTDEQREIIDLVLETYGLFNGKVLEKITHSQDAYKNTNYNHIINKQDIYNNYKNLNLQTKKDIQSYILKNI